LLRTPTGLSIASMSPHKSEIARGHLASRLRDALAEDPRMNVLDIEVQVVEGRVHLHGHVGSDELCRVAQRIVAELTEGMPIENRLQVSEPAHGPGNERIR
jgi:osmotically-inducible protein OsmY